MSKTSKEIDAVQWLYRLHSQTIKGLRERRIHKLIDWNYVLIPMNRKKESDRTTSYFLRAVSNTQATKINIFFIRSAEWRNVFKMNENKQVGVFLVVLLESLMTYNCWYIARAHNFRTHDRCFQSPVLWVTARRARLLAPDSRAEKLSKFFKVQTTWADSDFQGVFCTRQPRPTSRLGVFQSPPAVPTTCPAVLLHDSEVHTENPDFNFIR